MMSLQDTKRSKENRMCFCYVIYVILPSSHFPVLLYELRKSERKKNDVVSGNIAVTIVNHQQRRNN